MPGTVIQLDREFEFELGESYTFTYLTPAGDLQSIAILNPVAVSDVITTVSEIAPEDMPQANSMWGITSTTVVPRKFRVMSVKENAPNRFAVQALEYDGDKFAAIDDGVLLPDNGNDYSDLGDPTVCVAPTALDLSYGTSKLAGGRDSVLRVQFTASTDAFLRGYRIRYQVGDDNWVTLPEQNEPYAEISGLRIDVVRVSVQAVSTFNVYSTPLADDIDLSTGTATGKDLISDIVITGTAGTSWAGKDLYISWSSSAIYASGDLITDGKDAFFKRFRVQIKNSLTDAVITTMYTQVPEITIPYERIISDIQRTYKVSVSLEDVGGGFSNVVTAIITNPAPLLPSVTETTGAGSLTLTFGDSTDPDYRGIIVWADTSSGFTANAGTELWRGGGNAVTLDGVPDATIYYKYAAYDAWGDVDLNISTEQTATYGSIPALDLTGAIDIASFAAGIEPVGIVDTLPDPTGYTGPQVVFLTTDFQMYRYDAVTPAWTTAVPAVSVTGTLSDTQLAAIAAAKITGQITETQITDDAITTAKLAAGAVTAAEIAAGAIVAGKIAAGIITGAEIAAGTITASNILAGTITATQLAANSVIAGKIAAGAISATEIASKAITAEKLAVASYGDNLVVNGGAEGGDASAWYNVEGGAAVFASVAAASYSGDYYFRISGSGTSAYGCRPFPVVPGRKYIVRGAYKSNVATATGCYFRMSYSADYPAADTMSSVNRTGFTDLLSNGAIATSWTYGTYSWTCPAGVYWASACFYRWTAMGANWLIFDEVSVRESIGGELIVDGAITAAKIAAGTITADKLTVSNLAAISANLGSITAGSLSINSKFIVDSSGNVTIRNASTGQRLVLTNSLLSVYDSSNVLRVRLGIW
jgi:hypothetical protein